MKILSWEGIRVVLQEQDKLKQRDNMFRLEAIARAAHEYTLRQVRESLDGIDVKKHPSEPHKTICCMHCGNWNSVDDEVEQAKGEAIQTIKALLEE